MTTRNASRPLRHLRFYLCVGLLLIAAAKADSQIKGVCVSNCGSPPVSTPSAPPPPDPAEEARQRRISDAHAANERGIDLWRKGDYANAVAAFETALNNDPDNPTIKENLRKARAGLAEQRESEARAAKDKADTVKMTEMLRSLADSFGSVPSSSGLEFGKGQTGELPSNAPELDFSAHPSSDPKVVDTRSLSSGLPKALDDAIGGAFKGAPFGVIERVRKGYQAVMTRDWKLAKAWFQDALNRDSNNTSLKNLIKLTDYDKRVSTVQVPADSDVELLFSPNDESKDQSRPTRVPLYMLDRNGRPVELPDDYWGEVHIYVPGKDGYLHETPGASDMNLAVPGTFSPAPRSKVPIYRIDKAGNAVELPADYDGQVPVYTKGKDGKLIQVPKPSDSKYLFPETTPVPTRKP